MSQANAEQIETLRSMLVAGHRSVHLERHSLLLWGVVGGVLCAATQAVLTAERFPEVHQRAMVLLGWLALCLGGAGWCDQYLTRRLRRRRDETTPFAQAQITRAWWMLLAMGALGSFAMFFYGGGAMIYALWIVLLGLGVYLFGLFSRVLIEWIGVATILLGVFGLAAGLPFGMTRWLAASCFALGLPLASWLASRVDDSRIGQRGLALMAWLAVVVGVPFSLVPAVISASAPSAAITPLAAFRPAAGEQVVNIPAGTPIPLSLSLSSSLLAVPAHKTLPLTLTRPVDIALYNGQSEGRYRVEGSGWADVHDGLVHLAIDRLSPVMVNGLPAVQAHAVFDAGSLGSNRHE